MNLETTSAAEWVVGLIAAGGVTTFGFLIKKAFNDTTLAVTAMSVKLDVITAQQARSDGDMREMKAEVRSELKALRDRVEQVERIQREIA